MANELKARGTVGNGTMTAVLIRVADGLIYDTSASDFAATPTAANAAVTVTEAGSTGRFIGDLPAGALGNTGPGEIKVEYCDVVPGSFAWTDAITERETLYVGEALTVQRLPETLDQLFMLKTTIATLATQVSFTLTDGSTLDDTYVNCLVVIQDTAIPNRRAVGIVSAYTGATKTVTLVADPAVFTMGVADRVTILPESLAAYAIAIHSKLPTASANMAGEGTIAKDLDDLAISQPRINTEVGQGFKVDVSRRWDGTHECVRPVYVRAGAFGNVTVGINLAPLFSPLHVQTVGTPSVSPSGALTATEEGPRDMEALITLGGTTVADAEYVVTVPVTMTTGESVDVDLDVIAFAD